MSSYPGVLPSPPCSCVLRGCLVVLWGGDVVSVCLVVLYICVVYEVSYLLVVRRYGVLRPCRSLVLLVSLCVTVSWSLSPRVRFASVCLVGVPRVQSV